MGKRILEAKRKMTFNYDYQNDVLTVRIQERSTTSLSSAITARTRAPTGKMISPPNVPRPAAFRDATILSSSSERVRKDIMMDPLRAKRRGDKN